MNMSTRPPSPDAVFVNNGDMHGVSSYAHAVSNGQDMHSNTDTSNELKDKRYANVKPIFLREVEVYGNNKNQEVERVWIERIEIFRSMAHDIPHEHIIGIQPIGDTWRIYVDDPNDRLKLLAGGISMRGKRVPLIPENPHRPTFNPLATTRLRVSRVPLSADDGQIKRAITNKSIMVLNMFREKLRVDGKLTNCETGDRLMYVPKLKKHLPRFLQVGSYKATLWYPGQPKNDSITKRCIKCKIVGHVIENCTNEWRCNYCLREGHRQENCPEKDSEDETDDSDADSVSSNENQEDAETESGATKSDEKEMKTDTIPETKSDGKNDTEKTNDVQVNNEDTQKDVPEITQDAEVNKEDKQKTDDNNNKKKKKKKKSSKTDTADSFMKAAKDYTLKTPAKTEKPKDKVSRPPPTPEQEQEQDTKKVKQKEAKI